jgi:FtsH-binding integral membrane protein
MGKQVETGPWGTWVRLCVPLVLALIAVQFLALTVALFLEPDLHSSSCDFPEQCIDNYHRDAFAAARWLWWGGVGAALLGVLGLAASHAPRSRLVPLGGAIALFGASAFLSPVLRGPTAISYDGYGVVTVFSIPYLLAMLALGLAAVILGWDLTARSRSDHLTPGTHVRA